MTNSLKKAVRMYNEKIFASTWVSCTCIRAHVSEDAQRPPEDRPCSSDEAVGGRAHRGSGFWRSTGRGQQNAGWCYSSSPLYSSAVESSRSLLLFPSKGSSSSPLFICLRVGPLSAGGSHTPDGVTMTCPASTSVQDQSTSNCVEGSPGPSAAHP